MRRLAPMGEADRAEPEDSSGGNRRDPRAQALEVTVRYKSATVDEFVEEHSHDISRGGLFVKSQTPLAAGTLVKFELRIADDQTVMQGVGRVVWQRLQERSEASRPPGMGIKFVKLHGDAGALIERLVGQRTADGHSSFDQEPAQTNPSSKPPAEAPSPPPAAGPDKGDEGSQHPPTVTITVPAPVLSPSPAEPRVIVEPGSSGAQPATRPRDRPTQHAMRVDPAELVAQSREQRSAGTAASRRGPALLLLLATGGGALAFVATRPHRAGPPGRLGAAASNAASTTTTEKISDPRTIPPAQVGIAKASPGDRVPKPQPRASTRPQLPTPPVEPKTSLPTKPLPPAHAGSPGHKASIPSAPASTQKEKARLGAGPARPPVLPARPVVRAPRVAAAAKAPTRAKASAAAPAPARSKAVLPKQSPARRPSPKAPTAAPRATPSRTEAGNKSTPTPPRAKLPAPAASRRTPEPPAPEPPAPDVNPY